MSTLFARNERTVATWHPDTLFHGKKLGIQIRMVDGRIVHIRKGTVFTIANPRDPSTPFILKATWMSNSGREARNHPIGFGYDEWSRAGGTWIESSVLGVWPGCGPHSTVHLDLATITPCENPDGSPVPFYTPPPPTPESLGKELLDALSAGLEGEALRLLDEGASVHRMYTADKNTALHWACAWNLASVGLRLLAAGAHPTLRNKNFQQPLDLCRDAETRRILQVATEAVPPSDSVAASVASSVASSVPESVSSVKPTPLTKREAILAALRPTT